MGEDFNRDINRNYEDIVSDSRFVKGDTDIPFSKLGDKHAARKKHGKSKWWSSLPRKKKRLIISLTSVFLVIAMLLSWFFIYWRYNYNPITSDPEKLGFEGKIDKDVINIALFGIDTRNKKTFKGNSDSIMILSLNTELKTVKIVSVMRDTIVPINEEGKRTRYSKINAAYAKSPELAIKTLNEIFDLDISEYATVNFFGMTEIIDAVGGIDATVTQDELTWKGHDHPNLNNCMDEICKNLGLDAKKYYINSPGEYHMNGVQAVAYSRVRNCKSIWGTNNDYGRTDRQRHVMEQLFNKAITLPKGKYTDLAQALIPCTETSLSYRQIIGLAFNILLEHPTFTQARLPQEDWLMRFRWSGYGSVVYFDLDYAAKVLHAMFYDNVTLEDYVKENGVGKNDWFAKIGSSSGSSNKTSSTVSQSTESGTEPTEQPAEATNSTETVTEQEENNKPETETKGTETETEKAGTKESTEETNE